MKYITMLFLLGLSMSATASASPPYVRHAEGLWVNNYEGVTITVDRRGHDLRVRGLRRGNKSTHYERINSNSWMDRRGNAIVLASRNELLLIPHRRGRNIQLTRPRAGRQYQCRDRSGYDSVSSRSAILVRYYVRELDEIVEVQYIGDGLRARRQGGSWVTYQQHAFKKSEYHDRKGNMYRELPNGDLKWISSDRTRSLNLFRRR